MPSGESSGESAGASAPSALHIVKFESSCRGRNSTWFLCCANRRALVVRGEGGEGGVDDGPRSWWPCGESSGDNARNHGTLKTAHRRYRVFLSRGISNRVFLFHAKRNLSTYRAQLHQGSWRLASQHCALGRGRFVPNSNSPCRAGPGTGGARGRLSACQTHARGRRSSLHHCDACDGSPSHAGQFCIFAITGVHSQ